MVYFLAERNEKGWCWRLIDLDSWYFTYGTVNVKEFWWSKSLSIQKSPQYEWVPKDQIQISKMGEVAIFKGKRGFMNDFYFRFPNFFTTIIVFKHQCFWCQFIFCFFFTSGNAPISLLHPFFYLGDHPPTRPGVMSMELWLAQSRGTRLGSCSVLCSEPRRGAS